MTARSISSLSDSATPGTALPLWPRIPNSHTSGAAMADGVPRAIPRAIPRVLSIAGSDPSGGAGIQADLKSIGAMGGYGMAAITALTVQNTRGVQAVHVPPAAFLRDQLRAISADIQVDAVKIGMLGNAEVIRTVRDWLGRHRPAVVVLDPVLVATSGDRLLPADAVQELRQLVSSCDVVTPNIPELAALLDQPEAATWAEALEQGRQLAAHASCQVLVKGGHLQGTDCPDALVSPEGTVAEFSLPRVETGNTHGTGCSLSSALATCQVQLQSWPVALERAKRWLQEALTAADQLEVGQGSGPVHHFVRISAIPATPGQGSANPAAPGKSFTQTLWDSIEPVRQAIFDSRFIRSLADGTLPPEEFSYYLAQDAIYLTGYARVLSRLSAVAPSETEQRFWAESASRCLAVETDLHRDWLAKHPSDAVAGPVTTAYLNHLLAISAVGSYAEMLAAVLPCFWLYADVGAALANTADAAPSTGPAPAPATGPAPSTGPAPAYPSAASDGNAGHPYAAWLATYGDEGFAAATRQAIAYTDDAAATATTAVQDRMRQLFADSARFELEFFDAPGHRTGRGSNPR
jgi:hydroxymethylpyrimidine/phosphomethylpyrimidine kinase